MKKPIHFETPDHNWFRNLRHWLIKKIAMKDVILLNADIQFGYAPPGTQLKINNVNGMYAENCHFGALADTCLHISQVKK